MTFDKYIQLALRRQGLTNQRAGQALFNTLNKVRPDLAARIRNTDVDPYYRDQNISIFIESVQAIW